MSALPPPQPPPPAPPQWAQPTDMDRDLEHLRLLSVFHYVLGGITALGACIPILHVVMGLSILTGGFGGASGPPPMFGMMFVVMGGAMILLGWTMAILLLTAARCLAHRTHYLFCMVVAGLSCMMVPLGTVLGVFTILVLGRMSVKSLFAAG